MPATVTAKFRSVSGGQTSRSIGYIVKNATSDIDALDALELATPATYDGLTRSTIEIDEVKYPSIWDAVVTYEKSEKKEPPATGSIEYSFDASLENVTIYQSKSTVSTYRDGGGLAIDFKKAINVDGSDKAQGVSVSQPVGSFTLAYYPTWAIVTDAYRKSVIDACGKVNSATFRGHAAGEVRFAGCSGKSRNNTDWELTYRFEVRPNQTGLTIGSMTNISQDGWDVLWVYYGRDVDATTKDYILKPYQVNVERVFDRINFATVLGIS